jgi:hypothetical protein
MSGTLSFTAVTSGGLAYDVEFPLHPQTRSAEGVSDLLTALLDTISRAVDDRRGLSDGDILQALCLALAVRARMVGAAPESVRELVTELFDAAHRAACAATPYGAGRA